MAKNKKSKILASMLAVSTMAVFYAAPVMAAEFTLDSNSSVTTGTTTSGGYEQNEVHVNIDDGVNGSQTIGTFYSNEMEAGFKTDYTMTASTFTLEAGGKTWASLTVNGLTYTNQNTLNNVSLTADGLTFSNLGNSEATAVLNAAAINSWNEKTQNINAKETVAGKTYFDGKVIADKFGTSNDAFYVDENGTIKGNSLIIGKNGDNAVFKVDRNGNTEIKGNVTMAKDATVDGVDVSELGGNVAGISRNNGDLPYGQGVTSIEGSTSFDANGMNVGNGAVVANSDGSFSAGNGSFKVSDGVTTIGGETLAVTDEGYVTINNGAFAVGPDGMATVGNSIQFDGETGAVYANDLKATNNVYSKNYNLEEVGDNLDDLTGSVGNIGDNVAGIRRDAAEGAAYGEGVTSIEGSTSFDANGMVVGDNAIVANTDGSFSAGNGSFKVSDGVTTIGGETLAVTDEGYVTINNGAFAVGPDGMATVGNSIQFDGETGVVYANDLKAYNNVYSKNYNLEEVGADLEGLTDDFTTTNANVAGIKRTGSDEEGWTTTIEGGTNFDANGMVVGDNAVVANTDGSFSAANGAFDVDTNGNVTANRVTVGNTVVTGTSVTTDVIYANEGQIGGTLIKGGFVNADNVFSANYNLEEVGDNLADLTGSVGNIGDNVAGITRDAEDGAVPGEGTTTIENTLSVSGDSVLAQVGSSQLVITEDVAGLSSGNASFALSNNELQLSVAGNGLLVNQFGTNLNGTVNFIGHDGNSYTLSDLEGRVYDLEQKTQNITSTDPGQGGSSEVPPTGDGHTGFEGNVTVGGDINADKGNFNKVNTDEITVGDNTFIDGDSVNSNEGNFKDKVTVGSGENQTVINNGGITVGDSEGTSINHDEVRVGGEGGSYMNENDVVTGEGNSLNDTANRVGNLEQGVSELNNRVGELEDRIDKVGAMAAAIANLRTMGYDPAAPTEVAVGIGQYRDETGAALGLFHYPNRDFMLSLSVSTSGDEVMGGIGATWKFGRKSPEKVAEIKKAQAEADARRAEEAKLAKAEEMKQAAKEAKIKAQQERHAKLAAERAAQAEAAK